MNLSFPRHIKPILLFLAVVSLASLPGQLSKNQVPNISLGHAILPPPCIPNVQGACSDFWVPAGPAMDTLQNTIFTDESAEFTDIQSASPSIDFTDWPLTPDLVPTFTSSPNFLITAPISQAGYFEVQFMLANNFWGCDFNFGNSQCGIDIRQGIAHLIDRANFTATELSSAGSMTVDSPVPPRIGLSSVNPCAWDPVFPQTGANCVTGAPGGTAYHLGPAAGANGYSWLPAPGSGDLCAAAQHFINAGIAIGRNSNCVLTGIASAASSHVANFFIRSDDPARRHLGDGLSSEICYLMTGSYIFPCAYLSVTHGPSTAFAGFDTCVVTGVCPNWWMYTGGYAQVFPFDSSLYYTYNSRFVSGITTIKAPLGPCSASSVPSFRPSNYVYLCNANYDSISSQVAYAPCVNSGTQNTCPGTNQISAINAGMQTEDAYGKGEYSIPIFTRANARFAYLNNWIRVINGDGVGLPNYFTWLNAFSSNPAFPGRVRQGFSQSTNSVNPYNAGTVHDQYIVRNVYDSLSVSNPNNLGQSINWMTINTQQLSLSELTYPPPPGTTTSLRYTLRSDMFFQDSRKVTSFDVAFSYLSLKATGSFQSPNADPMTGITVLGPNQFDINLASIGAFTRSHLESLTILPARYWTNSGSSAWDQAITTCTATTSMTCFAAQYTVTSSGSPPMINCALTCVFSPSNMNVDPAKISASYNPISNGILIGSGPWQCGDSSGVLGSACTPLGQLNPSLGGYTLTRFGEGQAPASSLSSIYFRSAGNLALYIWSQNTGDITRDFLDFSVVAACVGKPVDPLGSTNACGHFQQGIGANGGPVPVGIIQVAIVNRWVGLNWVSPYNWVVSPPLGIAPPPPVLYEGSATLNPASIAGCSNAYPLGGYDC